MTDPRERRLLGWELVIVLAVFPFMYFIEALVSAATSIVNANNSASFAQVLISGHPGLSAPFLFFLELTPLAAPALVIYCQTRSGEGLAVIGLNRDHHPIRDLGRMFPIFVIGFFGAQYVGATIVTALGAHGFPAGGNDLPTGYLFLLILSAVVAGITEEIVVLGYLVNRLERLGWRPGWVVTVAVLVRMSYHLYYGVGALPIALWAFMSVILYRHYRRLPAFIAVHALWDSTIFASEFVSGRIIGVWVAVAFIATFVLWIIYRVDLSNADDPPWPPSPRRAAPAP